MAFRYHDFADKFIIDIHFDRLKFQKFKSCCLKLLKDSSSQSGSGKKSPSKQIIPCVKRESSLYKTGKFPPQNGKVPATFTLLNVTTAPHVAKCCRVCFSQRYSRSPYATHEPKTNGVKDEYRPTTPFAEHNHVTEQQVSFFCVTP